MAIRAQSSPGEVRVTAVADGVLRDFRIWRPGRPDGVGDLYRGRVRAVAGALGGCFVDLGGEDGFLPVGEGGKGLGVGDAVAVRVVRAAQAGKGARLSARGVELAVGAVGLVARGAGGLVEIAEAYPGAEVLVDDAWLAARVKGRLAGRISVVGRAFDGELEAEVAGLFESSVIVARGGMIHIEPTRALVAIDLDSGLGSGGESAARAHVGANLRMLPELARQIRLRELSGEILVDFAGLAPARRRGLGAELMRVLADDPRGARLVGFTGLGLAEIVRPRVHPPLHELMRGPHAAGLAALRTAMGMQRPRIRAWPEIVVALEADAVAMGDFARRSVFPVEIAVDTGLGAPGVLVEER